MAILPSFALVFRRRVWSARGALALVALSASAVAALAEPPLHPTLLSAEYQETAHPVVAAEKERPAVMIAGARKVLGATAPLQMARAARYHPVRAQLDPEVIERTRYGLADLSGAQVQAQDIKVSVDITAEDEVADAYLLVIVDDGLPAAAGKAAPRPPTLRLQAVGALRKDEARRVDFTVTRVNPQRTGGRGSAAVGNGGEGILYWQLFSEGIELRTNLSGDVAAFHRRREEGALRVAVAAWLRENARRDRGVQPFLQIPPLLPSKDGLPPSVVATLTVGADGLVSSVSLEPTPANEARQALENALGGWFFLPAVKAGQPVETRIRVPLKF